MQTLFMALCTKLSFQQKVLYDLMAPPKKGVASMKPWNSAVFTQHAVLDSYNETDISQI